MKLRTAFALLFLILASSMQAEQLNGIDDFNDNLLDVAKWGDTDSALFAGMFTETNGHLEYAVTESGNFFDQVTRSWRANFGATTNNWIARARVSLPDVSLPEDGDSISYTLGVFVEGGFLQTIGLNVRYYRDGHATKREYQGAIQDGGTAIEGKTVGADRSSSISWVQLRFDSASKVMVLEFSDEAVVPTTWTELTSYDLDSPEINFGLTDSSKFTVSLACLSVSFQVEPQHEVWADDFLVASKPVITKQPSDTSGTIFDEANFSVQADAGPNASYQWRISGVAIEGATSPNLILPCGLNRYGNYDVVISNPAGVTVSEEASFSDVAVDLILTIERIGDEIYVYWPDMTCAGEDVAIRHALQRKTSIGDEWEDIPKPYLSVERTWVFVFPVSEGPALFRMTRRPE